MKKLKVISRLIFPKSSTSSPCSDDTFKNNKFLYVNLFGILVYYKIYWNIMQYFSNFLTNYLQVYTLYTKMLCIIINSSVIASIIFLKKTKEQAPCLIRQGGKEVVSDK